MLHEFIASNRDYLIKQCLSRVRYRLAPDQAVVDDTYGIPAFLDQVIKTLQAEETSQFEASSKISGASSGDVVDRSEIGVMAKLHAQELFKNGLTFNEVVRFYGDICQSITNLAIQDGEQIDVPEFLTLNRCLDNATANAVTEFADRQSSKSGNDAQSQEHVFALQVLNRVQTAQLALGAIKSGKAGLGGLTGAKLDELLAELHSIADRKLSSLSLTSQHSARDQSH